MDLKRDFLFKQVLHYTKIFMKKLTVGQKKPPYYCRRIIFLIKQMYKSVIAKERALGRKLFKKITKANKNEMAVSKHIMAGLHSLKQPCP